MQLLITRREYKTKTGKIRVYQHAKIAQGYRENGKIKYKILKSIGSIKDEDDIGRARDLLEQMKKGKELISIDDVRVARCLEYGNVYACKELWKKVGLKDVFDRVGKGLRCRFDFGEVVFSLVAGRLSNPGSEVNAYEWIREDAFLECREWIEKQHLYRSLDMLIGKKEEIEKLIFLKIKETVGIKTDKVLYDLTSSWFEGSSCILAEFGYSRDKKRGKKQIVIGLILADGLPIAHFVFPGSTADKKTMKQTIEYLRKGLGIKRFVFVADRGIISSDNLRFLEEGNTLYIIATKRRTGKKTREMMLSAIDEDDKIAENLYVKEVGRDGGKRFILCFNRKRAEEDSKNIDSLIDKTKEKYKEYYGKKLDEKTKNNLKIKLGVHSRLFMLGKNIFEVDKEVYTYERKIAGRFLLVTTTDLSPKEVMEDYKNLWKIEQAFREIKSFIEVRPLYHHRENRVRAHVFICVLAFLLEALIERKLKEVSTRKAMREMKRIRVSMIPLNEREVGILSDINKEQEKIFEDIGIEVPCRIV